MGDAFETGDDFFRQAQAECLASSREPVSENFSSTESGTEMPGMRPEFKNSAFRMLLTGKIPVRILMPNASVRS